MVHVLLPLLGIAAAFLTGCAVGELKYPASWEPLPPAASKDCRHFEGAYADRGERPGHPDKPSLTRNLFGHRSGWEKAARVQFSLAAEGELEVTVWGDSDELLIRTLSAQAGDFSCEMGRLTVRDKRWVASELIAGREHATIELNVARDYLVAQVNEVTYGAIFVVVPIAADAMHWYRFPRLNR
jgi:hypothetical protein